MVRHNGIVIQENVRLPDPHPWNCGSRWPPKTSCTCRIMETGAVPNIWYVPLND